MQITPLVQTLAFFAVLIGWTVTNHQNNKRESRKEGRSACDSIKKYTLEISANGIKYLATRDFETALEIKNDLDLLEVELSRIPYFGIGPNSTLMQKFIIFSDALTGDDFEQKYAPSLPPTDKRAQAIIRFRNQLIKEVEKQFKMQFC